MTLGPLLAEVPRVVGTRAGAVLFTLGLAGGAAFGAGLVQVFYAPEPLPAPVVVSPSAPALAVSRSKTVPAKDGSLTMLAKANSGENAPEKQHRERFLQLSDLAEEAFRAGDYERSGQLANELLSLALSFQGDPYYEGALHNGHELLGRIALKAGDRKKAGEELLLAGQWRGQPRLGLARLLLSAGERRVVQDYLRLCSRTWSDPCVERWISDIEQGLDPILAPNFCGRAGGAR